MPLNDRQIKNLKPKTTQYKATDGRNLYLLVTPNGGKLWRFDYAHDGKRKTLSIGKYPEITLSEAREAAANARTMIAGGQDPAAEKQAEKKADKAARAYTVEKLFYGWHNDNAASSVHAAAMAVLPFRQPNC